MSNSARASQRSAISKAATNAGDEEGKKKQKEPGTGADAGGIPKEVRLWAAVCFPFFKQRNRLAKPAFSGLLIST